MSFMTGIEEEKKIPGFKTNNKGRKGNDGTRLQAYYDTLETFETSWRFWCSRAKRKLYARLWL